MVKRIRDRGKMAVGEHGRNCMRLQQTEAHGMSSMWAYVPMEDKKAAIEELALHRWCGQHHTGCLYFPGSVSDN